MDLDLGENELQVFFGSIVKLAIIFFLFVPLGAGLFALLLLKKLFLWRIARCSFLLLVLLILLSALLSILLLLPVPRLLILVLLLLVVTALGLVLVGIAIAVSIPVALISMILLSTVVMVIRGLS